MQATIEPHVGSNWAHMHPLAVMPSAAPPNPGRT